MIIRKQDAKIADIAPEKGSSGEISVEEGSR